MIGTSFGNSASSGGGFSPADITGLKLWLDADAANVNAGSPTNLDAVSTWVDKSTAANNLTQATAINQPTWLSSIPSLDFDGINDLLLSSSNDFDFGDENFSVLIRCKLNSSQSTNVFGKFEASGNNRSYDIWADESGTGFFRIVISSNGASGGGTTVLTSTTAISISQFYFVAMVYDAAANQVKVSIDGGAFGNTTHNSGAFTGSTADLSLGGNNGNFADIDVTNAYIFNSALSLDEINQLKVYSE